MEFRLLDLIRTADEKEFGRFLKDIKADTFPYVKKIVGDDITVEEVVFNAIYKLWIRRDEPQEDILNPDGWVRRIFINRALNALRRRRQFRRYQQFELLCRQTSAEVLEEFYRSLDVDKHIHALCESIALLPEPMRTIYKVRHLHGKTVREISPLFNLPPAKVSKCLSKARSIVFARMRMLDL